MVSENLLNMELECWEHSDKFVLDLVAMISASCRGTDTEVEVVVELGPPDQEIQSVMRHLTLGLHCFLRRILQPPITLRKTQSVIATLEIQ